MELGLDPTQLRIEIIRPALKAIDLWSASAEILVLGTAMVESRLKYVRQVGGPALGLWQCESATHRDIWINYISAKPQLGNLIKALIPAYKGSDPPASFLVANLAYGAAICRVHYRRLPFALPAADDAFGMSKSWKSYYNTHLGKGTVEKAMPFFQLAITT